MERINIDKAADLLLDMAALLLGSGSNSRRINVNVNRIASAWGYHLELFSSFTGIMITIKDDADEKNVITRFRRVPAHGVHYGIVSRISTLSWDVHNKELSFEETKHELEEIRKMPHTPRWLLFLGIGLASAALCLIMNFGTKPITDPRVFISAFIVFVGSIAGLYCRQLLHKQRFNVMICVLAASFVTSMIAGIDVLYKCGPSPEFTLATCVLYLVPGVPLLNAIMDLIEGHIPTAVARGIFGACLLLCIALGMIISMLCLGFSNY